MTDENPQEASISTVGFETEKSFLFTQGTPTITNLIVAKKVLFVPMHVPKSQEPMMLNGGPLSGRCNMSGRAQATFQ